MGAKVYITPQDVVLTKATHPTWNSVVAELHAAASQSYGSSTPRRVFIIAGETEGERRWDVPDAFVSGQPSTATFQSQDLNLEVYGVRNSAGQRPLIGPSDTVLGYDWSEARAIPHTPQLFTMSNSCSGRLLVQSLETRGCSIITMGTGILIQNTPNWTRTRPQTAILRDLVTTGAGRVVSVSFETPNYNYLQQRGTPNDTVIVEDCTFTEGIGTHLFYVDQIRASYFRRNKFAGANSTDMSAFRGVGMHCFVTDNTISDGNLAGTIQNKRDEPWWWNQQLVLWATKTFTGSTSQDTYVWPYRIAPGNESLLRVTISGAAPVGGLKTLGVDYTLEGVGDLTTDVVLSPELTAQLTGRNVTLNINNYRIPNPSPGQPWRTSAQPLSVQHGQQLVIEGNTLIKSEGYGGSATFDWIVWQKRWAWTGGHAIPYNPQFNRRIWDHWVWEGGNPTPLRGPSYCGQWNDAYWQSITDAGITMDPLSDPPYQRMRNPHINYLLLGPNTFVRGADPYNRAPSAAYILKAETDYPSHTDATNLRAYYAYGYQGHQTWPSGPAGMQSRAQAVVWPQEGMTFEGDWAPIWNHPRTWTVGTSTVQSHPGLFNWMPKVNTDIDSNIGFKKSPQANAEFEGEWAYDPKIHLLDAADVPNGYPDWWESKRDPEAGNPAPDYEHMIVDARNF